MRYSIFVFLLLFSCSQESKIPSLDLQVKSSVGYDYYQKVEVLSEGQNGPSETNGEIKKIGGFSRNFPKNSYSINLDSSLSINGLGERMSWILNASYIDKTFIRHRLSFDIFRSMSPDNIAPKTTYIHLFINGSYEGIYLVMEDIDTRYLRVDINDPSAFYFKECPVFRKDFLSQDSMKYSVAFEGTMDSVKAMVQLKEFYNFIKFSSDERFATELREWIDIERFIDWHLLLLITNNSDGIVKNFGLYKSSSHEPFKIVIWDYDHSFGRDGDYELNMLARNVDIKRSVLFERLMEHPFFNYRKMVIDRYLVLKIRGVLKSQSLLKEVDKLELILNESILKNSERWPLDGPWYHDANSTKDEVTLIRQFIKENMERLDRLIIQEKMSAF